jgi:hypothetical protein
MKDPLTRSLVGLAVAAGVAAWLVDLGGPVRLGLRDMSVEYAPGAFRLRALTPSGASLRWPDGFEEELPGGAWVSDWKRLPPALAPVELYLRHGPSTLRTRVPLDPSGWPRHLEAVPEVLDTVATIQFPVALRGWSSLVPEGAARWARYGVPPDWGSGWPGGGSAVLPTLPDDDLRELMISVHLLEGDVGAVDLVTDKGNRIPLGGPRWESSPTRGPTVLRLVLPANWLREFGMPQALEPPSDGTLRGRLRAVRVAYLGGEGDGSELEELLVELRSHAALALEGWAPASQVSRVEELAGRAVDRLEALPVPRYPDRDLRRLDQVVRLVEALEDLSGQLPEELSRYPGPLRYRGVVAAFRDYGRTDGMNLVPGPDGVMRELREVFRSTLPQPLDNVFSCWQNRSAAVSRAGRAGQTFPIFNGMMAWTNDLRQARAEHLAWDQGPTALARMQVLLFASRERGSLVGDRVAEAPRILDHLAAWMEQLEAGPIRDADLELTRRVRASLRPTPGAGG